MDYKSCPEPIELEECRKVGSPGGGNRFSNVGAFAHQILVFLEAWKGPWEKVIVQFLGKKESLCAERKAVYPSYKADQVLYAFHLVYHRYKYKTRRWSGDYQSDESSPVFSLIRVSRKKKIALLTDGHVFVEFEDHTRVIAFTHAGNFTIFVRALG